ncbi:hypothetical protein M0R72_03150 [Candidatus Pacearchaeota archaeon]|jgi:hypothetical protein|nr:hypothetical protein [Candidatus Pacearchaeota archaeon]
MKNKNIYQIISIILLITVITLAVLYFTKPVSSSSEIEEKALMLGTLNSWGENAYDSSEYIISADVYNFGYAEAKNVELTCNIYVGDENGYAVSETPVTTVTKKIGNIASTSYKYSELNAEVNAQKEGLYPLADCSISYCENCEILMDRISE